jgi:hypothetical protein
VTQFLFAHTVAEVLDVLAFVAIFAAAARHTLVAWAPATTPTGERDQQRVGVSR